MPGTCEEQWFVNKEIAYFKEGWVDVGPLGPLTKVS